VAITIACLSWFQQHAYSMLMLLLLLVLLLMVLVKLGRRYIVLWLLSKWVAIIVHAAYLGRDLGVGMEAARLRLVWQWQLDSTTGHGVGTLLDRLRYSYWVPELAYLRDQVCAIMSLQLFQKALGIEIFYYLRGATIFLKEPHLRIPLFI